jgi:hypothetical protein
MQPLDIWYHFIFFAELAVFRNWKIRETRNRDYLEIMKLVSIRNTILGILCIITLLPAITASGSEKVVKVFILAGQSNMQGAGQIKADPSRNGGQGSLEYLTKAEETKNKFGKLRNESGQWLKRQDVWISYLDREGPLSVGYGARQETIGPELAFGWVMGDTFDEPVLLIKCAWGGKSLAVDFRPKSAGSIPYSLGEKGDEAIKMDPSIVGHYYRETLELVRTTLNRVGEIVPGSDGSYEIIGFGWHQGWNDRINDKFNEEYESNMSHFIRDMRRDLGRPNLPFVIAETGMTGPDEKHPRALSLMKAQEAVSKRDEFRGNVAFVSTRNFWRPAEKSPSNQGYHWNSNAETYFLIGEAMAESMKKLIPEK